MKIKKIVFTALNYFHFNHDQIFGSWKMTVDSDAARIKLDNNIVPFIQTLPA